METNYNTVNDEELKNAAQNLLDAAMRYWKEYRRVTGGSAVVWVQDTDGRLVILTRGEYRYQLMSNIDRLLSEEDIKYFE